MPALVTVFSAPNYCNVYNNRGAVILVSEGNFNVQGYNSHAAPYYLPKKKDLFEFSMKFLGAKILDMFRHIMNKAESIIDDETDEKQKDEESDSSETDEELQKEINEMLEKAKAARLV